MIIQDIHFVNILTVHLYTLCRLLSVSKTEQLLNTCIELRSVELNKITQVQFRQVFWSMTFVNTF